MFLLEVNKVSEPKEIPELLKGDITVANHEYTHFLIDKMPKYVFREREDYMFHIRHKLPSEESYALCSYEEITHNQKILAISYLMNIASEKISLSIPRYWEMEDVFEQYCRDYETELVRTSPYGDEVQYGVLL